jgi:TetR/AcrR family transcriptional regulator, transcriptional repressor for nem operon
MRANTDQTSTSKARLLAHASAYVKTNGFAASPVDALTQQAGMTSGALYQHFAGKTDLFAAVLDIELQKTALRFAAINAKDLQAAGHALDAYLSPRHVAHPDTGCPLPSLTAEVARSTTRVRQVYQDGLVELHQQLSRITGSQPNAWALIAQSVGAVMLARALVDTDLQADLLTAVKAHSVRVLMAPSQ